MRAHFICQRLKNYRYPVKKVWFFVNKERSDYAIFGQGGDKAVDDLKITAKKAGFNYKHITANFHVVPVVKIPDGEVVLDPAFLDEPILLEHETEPDYLDLLQSTTRWSIGFIDTSPDVFKINEATTHQAPRTGIVSKLSRLARAHRACIDQSMSSFVPPWAS